MAWHRQAAGIMTGEPLPSPADPPDGYRYVPVPADRWRVVEGMTCRYLVHDPPVGLRAGRVVQRRYACGAPAVAALNRYRREASGLRHDSWWAYCAEHVNTYHRWIVGDRVLEWHLQEIEGEETG